MTIASVLLQTFVPPQTFISTLNTVAYAQPTLGSLAASAPTPATLDELALAVGVGRDLLLRVDARRQALPGWLVAPIAARLGVGRGEVRAAARVVLELAGFDRAFGTTERAAEAAYPPDRLLGEPLYPAPLVPTLPVIFAGP